MSPRPLALLTGATTLAALAVPAAAQAQIVTPSVPCVRYLPGVSTWQVAASGFTPNGFITVKADDQTVAFGGADPTGTLPAQPANGPSPSDIDDYEQTFQLTASDGTITSAPVALPVVRVGVKLPKRARPRSRVSYRVYGFAPGQPVYLHIRRRGKTLGRFNLGRPEGSCGKVTKRLRYMPLRNYRYTTYDYWFSQSRRYDRDAAIVRYKVTIFRTFRPSAAGASIAPAR